MVDSGGEQHHWLFGAAGNSVRAGVKPTAPFSTTSVNMPLKPLSIPTLAQHLYALHRGAAAKWRGATHRDGDCSHLVVDPSRNCRRAGRCSGNWPDDGSGIRFRAAAVTWRPPQPTILPGPGTPEAPATRTRKAPAHISGAAGHAGVASAIHRALAGRPGTGP